MKREVRGHAMGWFVVVVVVVVAGCAADPPPMPDAGLAAEGPQGGEEQRQPGEQDGGAMARDAAPGPASEPAPEQTRQPPELDAVLEPGDPGAADLRLEVRADRGMRAIDPRIYGTNGAPEIERTHQALVRSGGNRLTAYNWENNASNAGSDWMFQNDGYLDGSDEPGKVPLDVVRSASQRGAAAVITVPIVDHVSADKNGDGDVRNSPDYLSTRFHRNHPRKQGALADAPDRSDGDVYQDEFVRFIKDRAPQGAEVLFSLDNEPDLWSHTHAPVHPEPVGYQELWTRNRDYAAAIKSQWPEAAVLGVVSYGFNGYVSLQDAPGRPAREFLDWYLEQAAADHAERGQRLIDYLDLHWYPEARGGGTRIIEQGNNEALVEARIQAPRSLWDDSYVEDSWIVEVIGRPVDLLSWLQAKVDAYYPDTKLAFTEWNYGGGNHISGAIATADVLGIFGRHAVGAAAYWPLHQDERFAWAAFRAYRNYDGSGARFGNVSIEAQSSDAARASVYAALDADDPDRVVLVVISKAAEPLTAAITLAHPTPFDRAEVYLLAGDEPELRAADALDATADNGFLYTLPARSISVLELQPASRR